MRSFSTRISVHLFLNLVICCVPFTWAGPVLAAPKADLWAFWAESAADMQPAQSVDHSLWQQILDEYLVVGDAPGVNRVRYGALSSSDAAQTLTRYIAALEAFDPRSLSKDEQFAYWVNLYNAATVRVIVQAYPVESIRDTGKGFFSFGPWNDPVLKIAGQDVTLNDIEHRILRPIWQDPRIHFIVNCASVGCPNLMPTALTATNYATLLDTAEREFLVHPRAVSVDDGRLTLSSIFEWYAQDFGNSESEVVDYIAKRLPPEQVQAIQQNDLRIRYSYDWQLNNCVDTPNTDC